MLIDEINYAPPVMPGDPRPVTYRLTPKLRPLTPDAHPLPESEARSLIASGGQPYYRHFRSRQGTIPSAIRAERWVT